jgi:hypothetical protein
MPNVRWFKRGTLNFVRKLSWVGVCCIAFSFPSLAGDGSSSQHRAAEELLAALAAGDSSAMAQAIHESELALLRTNLLNEIKLQADRGETLLRDRLFGAGMPLADIERLTPPNFFVALSRRLRFGGRQFQSVDWLEAVPDSGGMVQMVGRLKPARELGTVRVPVIVSIVPWGKDWKAAIPLELQAQIDDLRTGRTRVNTPAVAAGGAGAAPAAAAPGAAPASSGGSPQALLQVLQAAEENLRASRCEEYYSRQMSPNFRRTTSAKALRALVSSCQSRAEIRERLLAAFTLARNVTPRFEYAGTRAIYDLRGQGLPFDTLVLEQVNRDWYIAE